MTTDGTSAADVALFDFGGVVIKTPFELLDTEWRGPFDPEADLLWQQAVSEEITEREYWHRRASEFHPDAEDPTFAFMRELYDTDEARIVRPEIVALLDELDRRGIRTAGLTNDLAAFHPPEWIERMTVIRRFDPLIDLSHAGFLKPAAEAFEYTLKVLDVDASQVVFFDDQPQNVEGAQACGIRSVRCDPTDIAGSVGQLRRALAPAGGLPSSSGGEVHPPD
ncbi:HAD-IA family hydrolase [Euzebya tangerina]|uniref:HAD-IA family hydrolase n=1 Tax=Euzebya tangerina TaxID=591198 RepID=UPI000E31CC82|nr:HAD-IA family hydrolase [Euzebya tangerina]